jgi:hypothetical protein
MKGLAWLGAGVLVATGAVAAACGGSTAAGHPATDAGLADVSVTDSSVVDALPPVDAGASCKPCTGNSGCGTGEICAQLGAATYCAPTCATSSQCTGDTSCVPVNDSSGGPASVCAPRSGVCAVSVSDSSAPMMCGPLLGPTVDAGCACTGGGNHPCQANGCRYGQYCDTSGNTCTPAPIGCGTPGAPYDGGSAPTGSVGADGGALSRLYFGVVGDTRPPSEDDTQGYPTAIITKIFQDLQALSPRPPFVVSTGDYQYANPTGTEGPTQLDLYLGARANYTGLTFPTMGNHECTGFTNSNCGADASDGLTNNYNAYMSKMLAPIGQTSAHYEIDLNAPDMSWTAKLLFVAANAWDQGQADWLDAAMSRATTYTFLIRHEAASSDTAPGVNPAETIMSHHPYTLSICGHTHDYEHSGAKEIIVGNGGAPLSGGVDYGYGMINQQADGTIAVDMIDYNSGLADSSFHFVVNPDGSPAK